MSLSKERRDERKVLAMKANEGRYIPLHKLYEIAAAHGDLLDDLEEAEAKRQEADQDNLLLIQTVKYLRGIPEKAGRVQGPMETIEQFVLGYVKHLESELASTRKQLVEAQALVHMYRDALYDGPENMSNARAEKLGRMGCDDALQSAIATAIEPYKRDAERYRWLRDQHTDDGLGEYSDVSRRFVHAEREPVPCGPGALDEAIAAFLDTALSAKEKSNG